MYLAATVRYSFALCESLFTNDVKQREHLTFNDMFLLQIHLISSVECLK